MKQETKIDTLKNLEARITAALTSTDITSTDLEMLLQETANALSDTVIKIERERAFDLTKTPDAAVAHRALTEAEFTRGRLRLVLPDLQHKLEAVREQEFAAQCEQEFLRLDAISDKVAEHFTEIPKLINKIIEIFGENEAVTAECSEFNRTAPPGMRHVIPPEQKARGLDNFSRANPPLATVTQLPDWSHSEKMLWPVKQSFFPFAPAPMDLMHTSEWGVVQRQQRRLNDARIDKELTDMERQREEFYRGR